MKVILYIRVSTQEQAIEGYSISEQEERLRLYCKAMGWEVVKVYIDPGYTGGDTDRPGLHDLRLAVQAGLADKVLVYKIDRLSRSQKDMLELIDEFKNYNTGFVSMTEPIDTATPTGRLIVGVLAAFAELEREQIKERMSMGKEGRAKMGKWHGSTPPIGYDYIDGMLVPNEFEKWQVQEVYKLYLEGVPLRRIEIDFKAKGIKYKTGYWTPKIMRYVMANRLYLGEIRHRDTWYKGLHEPLIDEETFNKANRLLKERHERFIESGIKTGTNNQSTYFGGLIYCKWCGAKYGKCNSGNKQYGYHLNYGCYSRHKKVKAMIKDPNCKNKTYRMDAFDAMMFDELRKLESDPEYINRVREDNRDTETAKKINLLEKEHANVTAQISRFMDLYGLGRYTIEQLDEKVLPLDTQRKLIEIELKQLRLTLGKLSEEETRAIVSTIPEVLELNDFHRTRTLIETLIDRIVIDGEDITIYWNFA